VPSYLSPASLSIASFRAVYQRSSIRDAHQCLIQGGWLVDVIQRGWNPVRPFVRLFSSAGQYGLNFGASPRLASPPALFWISISMEVVRASPGGVVNFH
jgi:hypothetical protein